MKVSIITAISFRSSRTRLSDTAIVVAILYHPPYNATINLFIEETPENKKYLIELIEYLLENNYLSNTELKTCVSNMNSKKDDYKIDYPNIEKDIIKLQKLTHK